MEAAFHNRDPSIHKYTFTYAIYHDEARFSPHEATKAANEAKNVDDRIACFGNRSNGCFLI
jgi:hypothetical protein